MADPFDLQRFVAAQDAHWPAIRAEVAAGAKRSHWMWYVFPQIAGLGHSPMAVRYALSGVGEARAYLAHPVLGPRLRELCGLLLGTGLSDPVAVMGGVDAMKLRSSMTLFDLVAPGEVFAAVLARFYGGEADAATLRLAAAG